MHASPLSSQCASPVASQHASQKSSGYSSPVVSHHSSEQTFKAPSATETEDGIAVEPPNKRLIHNQGKSLNCHPSSHSSREDRDPKRSEVASPSARDVNVAKRSASEGVKISHANSLSTADVQTGPVIDKDAASKTLSETDPRHLQSTTDKPPSGKSSSSVLNIRPSRESHSTEHNQGETGPPGKETSSAGGTLTKTPSSHSRTSTSSQHSASSKTSSGSGKSSSSSQKSCLSGKHSRKSSRASPTSSRANNSSPPTFNVQF
ncbi:hypothetical protein BSL78_28340 [Apostichopus japonicus]|uniref:Uncharacterized protein n=1 Tax=Stichopus japonicus TaxID=307972 RepID=A0A2G8JGF9_STIJA|nr:hypothetical protein BSL78_28340 [Apostichopus japonicus]